MGVGVLAGALLAPAVPAQEGGGRDATEAEPQELAEELKTQEERLQELRRELETLETLVPGSRETAAEEPEKPEEPPVEIGGAARLNYTWQEFSPGSRERGGDLGLELFRLDVSGTEGGIEFSAQYRWYPYMDTVHHAWAGVEVGETGTARGGIMRVPFGLLPYAAHNYWFGVPYYMGFADDYDAGVQYLHRQGGWDLRAAFFKNAELGSPASLERYSIDVVEVEGSPNQETNQANLRAAYTFGAETPCEIEVGASGQAGQLYNAETRRNGDRWAAGGHMDLRCGRWNLQLEGFRYAFNPESPADRTTDTITVGALATSYELARRGTVGVANVAYNLPVDWPHIDLVTCYNDYSILAKDADNARNSALNTTGCAVGSGPLFVYLDLIQGRNMVFFGGDGSLGVDGDADWETQVNLNVGYYF
ncbi:hypothetical protein AN478_09010 [Thiohalorhabdus denitrificans]|uniref:hypothetical protein n=1 Tax=Thiohalorhabdus denitrificans TaxID=381306 RepID=UPI0006D5B382|nr:hypothetical protein [Thiohalorhabdus denitrificans]KPV40245.1 hypothetical protein AN478_09010 [Thiohalorhabdus denitrificans]